eukprot:Sspe_Gene.119710::Locus_116394_Transcript_1_1_Confidence_1.000_Length_538::g.119710::m.119710
MGLTSSRADESEGIPLTQIKRRPQWVGDKERRTCSHCRMGFTVIRRRHHCRACGGLFCDDCTAARGPIHELGYLFPVRQCQPCYEQLLLQDNQMMSTLVLPVSSTCLSCAMSPPLLPTSFTLPPSEVKSSEWLAADTPSAANSFGPILILASKSPCER